MHLSVASGDDAHREMRGAGQDDGAVVATDGEADAFCELKMASTGVCTHSICLFMQRVVLADAAAGKRAISSNSVKGSNPFHCLLAEGVTERLGASGCWPWMKDFGVDSQRKEWDAWINSCRRI